VKLDLFQEVVINRDIPELKIVTGDIAILNDYVTDKNGNDGCVLEIYTASGKFVDVVTLPIDNIEPLRQEDRFPPTKPQQSVSQFLELTPTDRADV
jgi:hypothetical protein